MSKGPCSAQLVEQVDPLELDQALQLGAHPDETPAWLPVPSGRSAASAPGTGARPIHPIHPARAVVSTLVSMSVATICTGGSSIEGFRRR